MDYFTLDTQQSDADPMTVEAALRRAWNACAGVACTKCGVPAGQYCRNQTRSTWRVTRFHRPRQDAAGVPRILAAVKIRGLSWAKGKGAFAWDDRRIPTAKDGAAADGQSRVTS